MIPLAAVILDSEVGRALAKRLSSEAPSAGDERRVQALEDEVKYLSETVQSLEEETRFIRNLLEKPRSTESASPGEG